MTLFRSLVVAVLLLLVSQSVALAQYIYIDVDGDGVNTSADQLNAEGPTVLTLYLNTNHDRDGSLQTCNSHTAASCSAPAFASALSLFSYQVYLSALGGTVAWGTFAPDTASFTALQPQVSDSTDVQFTFSRPPGSSSQAGLSSLGRIPVTIISGSPSIVVARFPNTPLDPSSLGTSFGTNCNGFSIGNTYVLGDPADPCGTNAGLPGDWFDTNGAGAPNSAPEINAPANVVQPEGSTVTIVASATDPDANDHPALAASGYPTSLTFSSTGSGSSVIGTLTGMLGFNDAGSYDIHWEATDESGSSSSETTNLEVPESNYPPVINAPGVVAGNEGSLIRIFPVTAQEPEGEAITFTADLGDLPAGNDATFSVTCLPHPDPLSSMAIASSEASEAVLDVVCGTGEDARGNFSWTPTYSDAGTYRVIFTATAHSMTSRDTTFITVANRPACVVVQAPTTEFQFKVDAHYFRATCTPGGQECEHHTYFSDAAGHIAVPLEIDLGNGATVWWDKVHIEVPAWTPEIYLLIPYLAAVDLYPAANPADRITGYAPPYQPWHVQTLVTFNHTRQFMTSHFHAGFERGQEPMAILMEYGMPFAGNAVFGYQFHGGASPPDYINWPYTAEAMEALTPYPIEWMAGHEYMAAFHSHVFWLDDPNDGGHWNIGACQYDDVCNHSTSQNYSWRCQVCDKDWFTWDPCAFTYARGAWSEGVAIAFAELFYRATVNPSGTSIGRQICLPGGAQQPGSVAGFASAIMRKTPVEFIDRWTGTSWWTHETLVPDAHGPICIAQTASDYFHLWRRENAGQELDLNEEVGEQVETYFNPAPGTWSINDLYNFWFSGTGVSGVQDVSQTAVTPRIRIYPNPTSSLIMVEGSGQTSGGGATIQVFNARGELILTKRVPDSSDSNRWVVTLPGSGLASGIYWVRMARSDGRALAGPTKVVIIR